MENFTPLELFNKIYKYLEKSLFDGYRVIVPSMIRGERFVILYYEYPIISFYLLNNNLYYSIDTDKFSEIKTIKDIDCALYKCGHRLHDGNFSLFLKCNLI